MSHAKPSKSLILFGPFFLGVWPDGNDECPKLVCDSGLIPPTCCERAVTHGSFFPWWEAASDLMLVELACEVLLGGSLLHRMVIPLTSS